MRIASYPLILLIGLIYLSGATSASAQRPGGRTGVVYGKALDSDTKKPVEYGTVAIYHARNDSLVTGAIVRPNGDFVLDGLPMAPLRLTISFIGYKTLVKEIHVSREQLEQDLGNLLLEPDAEILKEFEVTGEKSTSVLQVDRRVFNVDKDLTTQGGTGVDVMKNIPGLSVDVDGNVQMRGSNPQLLIDGRPTSMTLEQIPAEEIERVELITNPSVAFDANTAGGILNVVLKKNTKPGYSGQLQAGVGTNDRYQVGGNVNVKDGRWGFNLSYNLNTRGNYTNGDTRRTDRFQGENTGYFEQDSKNTSIRRMHGGRFGMDYQVSVRSTISASASVRAHVSEEEDTQNSSTFGAGMELLGTGRQVNTNWSERFGNSAQLAFRHRSPKEGKEWSMDLSYYGGARKSDASQDLYTYDVGGGPLGSSPRLQDNIGGSRYGTLSFQADLVDPRSERTKFEYGVKSSTQLDNTYLDVYVTSPTVGTDVRDSSLSNDYDITNLINAAYFNWSQKLGERWSMMAGLRFEQTWFKTLLKDSGKEFSYIYPDGTENLGRALFPSLYLVRRWADSDREFQINFSRKIQRPNHWQIIPFIMFSDARNVRIGNPTLAPEMSNLAEANHLLPFLKGKGTWLTSVFGRYTTDVITGYATPLASDTTILLNTFINGSFSATGGWENIIKLEPTPGLQLTFSGTVQYTDIALRSSEGDVRNRGTNWEAKAVANYRFKKVWTVQLNGEYESPEIQAQGRRLAQYGMDASVSRDFAKRLTAVVSVNDIFYTRRWGSIVDTPYLYQESFRRREQRFIRFTLTWKFGEQNTSLFRKRSGQARPSSGAGSDGGEGEF
ncbi:MAG: outer membrane beta-barrel protein [Flavobacteriales bacterium]|nr:outer membrane beta-barrel protein [Flavobacteriales bacterium]